MELPKFDFSKPPHPQTIDLFLPFIPGSFFAVSVLAANQDIVSRVHSFALGPYSRTALFLFAAYFSGLSALVLSTLLLRSVLQIFRSTYFFFGRRLRAFQIRITHQQQSDKNSIRRRFATWLQQRELLHLQWFSTAAGVWGSAATQLLQQRYGIEVLEEMFTSEEWGAWRTILGTPNEQEVRGSSFVRALGASGCAGLLAWDISSQLHLFHYRSFCLVLVLAATVYSLIIEWRWMDPVRTAIYMTTFVLRDIPQPPMPEPKPDKISG
jgi:hypothetical protein